MAYIKNLVMHGFKSFVRKTEIPFTPEINVILGPNGSGKSNITDALCFVLGRLSIKSMRAAKAKNLIFAGTKLVSPAKEASVEIVFDNSDKVFSIDNNEISIKRIVRKNGQSIYKINGETKTRQEVLVLLAQAGIDPNGFNIILQNEIQNFVRMHTEERRKVLEEVSGISIYESRKEKALKELEKTDEKLKEVLAILRERTIYLNNLEKERQQALKFKKLEQDSKNLKASILNYDLNVKQKELDRINKETDIKFKSIEKIRKDILQMQNSITSLDSKIKSINDTIQKSAGLEQERLNQEINDIRAELAGLSVKIENYESKFKETENKKQETEKIIRDNELSIRELNKSSPSVQKKEGDIQKKKKELEILEEKRKRFYMVKSELKSLKERIEDKKNSLQDAQRNSGFILKQIEHLSEGLFDKKTSQEKLDLLHSVLYENKSKLEILERKQVELERIINISEHDIFKLENIKNDISKMDICPLCKSTITPSHIKSIHQETNPKIKDLRIKSEDAKSNIKKIHAERQKTINEINKANDELVKREADLFKISQIQEKNEQIKNFQISIDKIKSEVEELQKRNKNLEKGFDDNSNIEQQYETLKVEVQEMSYLSEENVDSEISFKQRELERSKILLKQLLRTEEDLTEEINSMKRIIEDKESSLENKISQEEELSKKFKRLIAERDFLHDKIRQIEADKIGKQNEIHIIEQEVNNLKIEKARVDAEYENIKTDLLAFTSIEIIKASKEVLSERLAKIQEILSNIGSVNLRSLEVYDLVKQEYDSVRQKVETVEHEKNKILKITHEIDVKKKKTFLKTLYSLNETFSRNFSQLSTKGHVFLELENKKDPFEGGVSIVVKVGQGKYFDVTSLSGGEQTLVALSLIFAIQELSPYCFYILDEIDAALDKRNSERLASLLNKYMKKGQYIVVTHNDEVISSAKNLYGVSMHDGVSKIISLKV